MNTWAPIQYRGFWDVPTIFVFSHKNELFLFDCEFDEEVEDFRDHYKVYLLPPALVDELPKDWTGLHQQAIRYLGTILVEKVRFDPTRRQMVDYSVLEELTAPVGTN